MANNSLTGQTYALKWGDFQAPAPANPPGGHVALTNAGFSVNFNIRTGEQAIGLTTPRGGTVLGYTPDSIRIRIFPNRNRMWSVASARTADVLNHEQGHYNIVAQLMWDLFYDLQSPPEVFTASRDALEWANGMVSDASALNLRFQSNGGVDGLYDSQTDHGLVSGAQARWDRAFGLAVPPTGMRFTSALRACSVDF